MLTVFALLMVVVAFFFPGIAIGNVPLPAEYGVAAAYVVLFNPRVPRRYMAIFAVAVSYLVIVAGKNAIGEDGSTRDLLYAFLFIGELLLFCSLLDLFDRGRGDTVIRILIACATLNLIIMIVQMVNPMSINDMLVPLWEFPLRIFSGDKEVLIHAQYVEKRPYGLMPGFNFAGLAMYLAFRAAYVYTGKFKYLALALLAVLVATARMLTIFFVLFELVAPILLFKRGKALIVPLAMMFCGAVVILVAVLINPNYYLVSFATELASNGLEGNFSWTNRLESLYWALDHWELVLTFGGITSTDFLSLSRAVDSELVLRSMQFGLIGFVLIVMLIFYYFQQYRSYDTYFLLGIMLWTSLTSAAASSFILCPFLMIYGFACRARFQRDRAVTEPIAEADALQEPRRPAVPEAAQG